jgi:hypothetical protein
MGFDTNKWFKQKYFSEAGIILESELVKALNQAIPDNTGYKEFAKAVATILKDEYGSHNFSPFMEVLHAELGMEESLNEVADDFYPDSPEALSAATAKAKEILDKHKASIKAIADKYEGQANKSREMMDELNALIDVDLEDVPFQDYVSNKVKGTLGKALFRYYAQKNPELAKIMR